MSAIIPPPFGESGPYKTYHAPEMTEHCIVVDRDGNCAEYMEDCPNDGKSSPGAHEFVSNSCWHASGAFWGTPIKFGATESRLPPEGWTFRKGVIPLLVSREILERRFGFQFDLGGYWCTPAGPVVEGFEFTLEVDTNWCMDPNFALAHMTFGPYVHNEWTSKRKYETHWPWPPSSVWLAGNEADKMVWAAKAADATKSGLGKGYRPGHKRNPYPNPNKARAKYKNAQARKSKSLCIGSRSKLDNFVTEQGGEDAMRILRRIAGRGPNKSDLKALRQIGVCDLDSLLRVFQEECIEQQMFNPRVTHEMDSNTFRRLSELMWGLRKASESATGNVLEASSTLAGQLAGLTGAINKGLRLDHHLKTEPLKLGMDGSTMRSIFMFVMAGLCVVNASRGKKFLATLNVLALVAVFVYEKGSDMMEWFTKLVDYFRQAPEKSKVAIEPQGGWIPVDGLANVATGAVLASIFTSLKSKTVLELTEEFGKKSMHMKKINEGFTFTIEFFATLLEEAIGYVSGVLGGERVELKSDPFWEVRQYATKVARYEQDYASNPLRDSIFAAEILALIGEGEELRVKMGRLQGASSVEVRKMSEVLRSLHKIKEELSSRLVSAAGQRPEPVLLLIAGPPGIGKTWMMNALWPTITAEIIEEHKLEHFRERQGDFVFAYNQADQYCSGYNGQFNMIVDEMGFMTDVPGQPSVWSDLIQWVNVNPMNLNMAALHEKGRSYFRSRMIYATTNRQHFNRLQSIEEPQAVYRRLDFTFVAGVQKRFSTDETKEMNNPWDRRLDVAKLMAAGITRTDFQFLEFHQVTDHAKGEFSSVPITYAQLRQRIVERYHRSSTSDMEMLQATNKAVNEVIERRIAARKAAQKKVYPQGGPITGTCMCPVCDKKFVKGTMDRWATVLRRCGVMEGSNVRTPDGMISVEVIAQRLDEAFVTPQGVENFKGCLKTAATTAEFVDTLVFNLRVNEVAARHKFEETNTEGWTLMRAVKYGAVFAGLLSGAVLLYRAFNSFGSSSSNDESEIEEHGEYGYKKGKSRASDRRALRKVRPQSGEDPNASTLATKLARKSLWRFRVESDVSDQRPTGNILVLQNNVVLFPEHYCGFWQSLYNGDEDHEADPNAKLILEGIWIHNRNTGEHRQRSITIPLRDILTVREDDKWCPDVVAAGSHYDDDLVAMYLPGITGPSIVKLLRGKNDKLPFQHRGVLAMLGKDHTEVYHTAKYTEVGYREYATSGNVVGHRNIEYEIPTRVGDCGSPFLLFNKGNDAKIMSIHVGGARGTKGIGVVVEREAVERALEYILEKYELTRDRGEETMYEPAKVLIQCGDPVTDLSGFVSELRVKPIPQMQKTRIEKSPINGKLEGHEPKKMPAMLRPTRVDGKLIDPMVNARWGYGLAFIAPSMAKLRAATDATIATIFRDSSAVTKEYRRELTYEEAIAGLPGIDHAQGINRATSPGWPFKHLLPNGSKKAAFGSDEWEFSNEYAQMIIDYCKHAEKTILAGDRPFFVNNDFLKDELRKIDRAREGKTRLISSSDIGATLVLRRQTLGFVTWVMDNCVSNGIAVGMNPMGDDWTRLAKRHGGNAPNVRVMAGDYSGYDKGLMPALLWQLKEIMSRFYQDRECESEKIRNAMVDEIAQSRHVCGDAVYSWMGSNPSGNPMTTVVNSYVNLILFRYALLVIEDPENEYSYDDMREYLDDADSHVHITAFGDDNLISVQLGEGFDHITQDALTEAFATIGMVYTDESKTTGPTGDRRLTECTFLKRGFAQTHHSDRSRWMAPLDIDTIMESIQWTKSDDIDRAHWKKNVENMIVELSVHGRDVWKQKYALIEKACALCEETDQFVPIVGTWADCQDKFVSLKWEI